MRREVRYTSFFASPTTRTFLTCCCCLWCARTLFDRAAPSGGGRGLVCMEGWWQILRDGAVACALGPACACCEGNKRAMRKRACFNQECHGNRVPLGMAGPKQGLPRRPPVHGLLCIGNVPGCLGKRLGCRSKVCVDRGENATASDCLASRSPRLRTCFSLARALSTICSTEHAALSCGKLLLHDAADTC